MRPPQPDRASRRVAALAALALGWSVVAGRAEAPPFTIVPLPGRAWIAVSGEGANSGIVTGPSGVLVVDPPTDPRAARLFLGRARALARRSPRWLVHTRADASPSQGDRVFSRAVLIRSDRVVDLGDSRAEVSTAAIHPGGDLVVFVDRGDVLFAGDLFERGGIPDLSGADTGAWVRTLEGFLARHPASYFVGSRGEAGRALDVRYLRDYLAGLRLAVGQALARGESGPPLAERLLAVERSRFGRWNGFDARARRNIEEVERELKAARRSPR